MKKKVFFFVATQLTIYNIVLESFPWVRMQKRKWIIDNALQILCFQLNFKNKINSKIFKKNNKNYSVLGNGMYSSLAVPLY